MVSFSNGNGKLDFIFNPKTVAVIGASAAKGKWGNAIMKNLVDTNFEGKIYPVNPRGGKILNLDAYPSIKDIEEPVDLAVIGIPVKWVPDAVKECAEKGVRGIVIVTAGFAEMGAEGKRLQDVIVKEAKKGGVRIVGPNCLGLLSASSRLNASLLPYTTGDLSLISQSGNFSVEMELLARRYGLGFSKLISIGNQADIQFHEYIEEIKNDPLSKVILVFVEALCDGSAFLRKAKEASRIKPVVALKVGATAAGTRATLSHTGSLAGMDAVYDAAFKQAGVIRVTDTHDLLDVGEALSKLPPMNGNRIVVLTDGGGHAAAAADAAEKHGLVMPSLSEATQKRLKEVMLPQSNTANPVDFAGAAENDLWTYKKVMEIIFDEEEIDGLLVAGAIFGGYAELFEQEQLEIDVATEISEISKKFNKPVVLHSPYPREEIPSIKVMREGGVPVYQRVETAALCLAAHARYWEYRRKSVNDEKPSVTPGECITKVKDVLDRVRDKDRRNLIESEAMEIFAAYDLPVPRAKLASDTAEAVSIANALGGPVVAKICSPQIVHKSDAGGVRLDLKGSDEVEKACAEILANAANYDGNAEIHGLMISEMLPRGTEVIVGGLRDPQFGPVVMFGIGGIFVEVFKDIAFRVAPILERDAREMIEEIKGYPILKGMRGESPRDIDAIMDMLMKVSHLLANHPDIAEFDLNPVIAFERGVTIADARIILSEKK